MVPLCYRSLLSQFWYVKNKLWSAIANFGILLLADISSASCIELVCWFDTSRWWGTLLVHSHNKLRYTVQNPSWAHVLPHIKSCSLQWPDTDVQELDLLFRFQLLVHTFPVPVWTFIISHKQGQVALMYIWSVLVSVQHAGLLRHWQSLFTTFWHTACVSRYIFGRLGFASISALLQHINSIYCPQNEKGCIIATPVAEMCLDSSQICVFCWWVLHMQIAVFAMVSDAGIL